MSTERIIKEYEEQKATLDILESKIVTLFEDLSNYNKVSFHDIRARVKERDSLQQKIEKKQGKYSELNDITDVVGIRIITYFNDDVDKLATIIEDEFSVDQKNSVDKRKKDPDRFGYASLHFVVTFNDERLKLIEYKHFEGIKFEIQIRSILQHAWAEIEHDIGYKSKNEVPEEIRRDFSRIAGLLELADMEFLRIKGFIEKYTEEIETKIENNSLMIKLDKVTLTEYINKSRLVEGINNTLEEKYHGLKINDDYTSVLSTDLEILRFFDINKVIDLDELLSKKKEKVLSFFEKWYESSFDFSENRSAYPKDISLFYLYYVLIYENYSEKLLSDYLEISSIDDDLHQSVIDDFNNLKNEDWKLS
ncbi:GTP pyrophosphokinase family protein [Rossellomorea sp. GCM10028870]|uniref:GTP pyrophosphokinase n=1 Tax=Rossellomorea sp. GCM10028870 TaxID=3273426 RepID=UPI00360D630A